MSPTRSSVTGNTVVVTGMGAVSALGTGCAAHLQALREGRDGLRPTARFDTRPYASGIAGTWPAWDGRVQPVASQALPLADSARAFSTVEMALAAGREAWAACGRTGPAGARTALVLGTCFGQGFSLFHQVSEAVAAGLQVAGPVLTLSTACSSSTNAIGLGRDLLMRGEVDVVLAGGVDTLLREAMAGFNALGVISRDKCAPFGEPYGINLAEGAGMLVLERAGEALARGGRPLATVDGYGLSADAHHETTPDPTGAGLARAIRWALDDAAVEATAIDHVNAHATGTESNDRSEAQAIVQALGPRVPPVPVSGLKSFLGHAQGAAGVLELILGILALGEGALPPTLRLGRPRPGAPADPVPGPGLRRARVRHALNISAAFGGANAVLVYGAPATARPHPQPAAPPARVILRGLGLVSPLGPGLDELAQALAGGRSVAGRVPPLDLGAIVPTADPRGCDPSSLFVTVAAATAMREAGLPARGARRHDTGLFLAATRMPQESARRCQESLDRHGPAGMSAAAFARMAVNAPAGACAKHLGLRGPTTTLSVGAGSGLAAIASAAAWLAGRADARRLLVAAVDEEAAFEGATAALLERVPVGEPAPEEVTEEVTVAGWGLAGPADAAAAARAALGDQPRPEGVWGEGDAGRHALAPLLPDASLLPLGFRDLAREIPPGEACISALAFLLAVLALRQRRARSLLLVAGGGRSASVAVLLRREGGTP